MSKVVWRICLSVCVLLASVGSFAQSSYEGGARMSASDARSRARVHTELGAAYFEAAHMGAALDELKIALEADSAYAPAYSMRGLVHAHLKEDAKADADFRRALEIAPRDPEVNNNYGWFLCQTGRAKQSVNYFVQALKDPLYETPWHAYTNAGMCSIRAGDLDAAQGYLLNAIRVGRDGAYLARFHLADLLYRRGNLSESRVYLAETMKAIDPPSAEMLWLALRLERRLGNRAAEATHATQLRNRYPTSPEYQEFLKGNFE